MTALYERAGDIVSQPWRDIPQEGVQWMRPHLPGLLDTMVEAVLRHIPEYARPQDPVYVDVLRGAVTSAMEHFIRLVDDPQASSAEIEQVYFEIGYGEAIEGRDLEHLQNAMRLASRVAWRYLAERAPRDGLGELAIELTEANFAYLDLLASAATRGYGRARERAAGEREQRRGRLLGLLLSDPPAPRELIVEQARLAAWPLPARLAVIVLSPRPGSGGEGPSGLPPFLLSGVDRGRPCLIMPDPDRPGGDGQIAATLAGWTGAIGPAVPLEGAGVSLRWAHRTLDLMSAGRLGEEPRKRKRPRAGVLLRAERHLSDLLLQEGWTLAEAVAARRLAPLAGVGVQRGRRLAETLLECLRHGFNATEAAEALCVHPQTVRYRLAQLHEIFDFDIEDPTVRLELMLLLPVWLRKSCGDGAGEAAG